MDKIHGLLADVREKYNKPEVWPELAQKYGLVAGKGMDMMYGFLRDVGAQVNGEPSETETEAELQAVQYRAGDRVVCLGTAFGRFQKGEVGTIERLGDSQADVLLDGRNAPVRIDFCSFEHADGIAWELRDPRPRVEAVLAHVKTKGPLPPSVARGKELEDALQELFDKQDLNGNGVLEELELVKLNQKIAMLHFGKDSKEARKDVIEDKFVKLFREKLDIRGEAIVYPLFREHILERLDSVDPDPRAQIMIVDQWIAEAESGRQAFRYPSFASESDAPFLPHLQVVQAR